MANEKRGSIISSDQTSIISKDGTNGESGTHWRSIYIAAVLSFVGSAQFSLYFSALWPYLRTIDKSATEQFFGYIVAIYSLGQIISSPTFGYWSNKIKQVRLPLYVGLFLMVLGNILYISLELVAFFPRKWLMLIGRLITGAGSGNVTLLRTYASTASTFKDRNRAIAYVTCGQALGTTCGPVLQLIFTPLGENGFRIFNFLTFNLYTAPAYLACLMNIFGAIALKLLFKENYVGLLEGQKPSDGQKSTSTSSLPMYDIIAVLVCYFARFTQMFINTNLETVGSAFSMLMFNFSEAKSVLVTSIAQGGVGILTFATYFAYIKFDLEKLISSRIATAVSLIALIAFHVITYSWPFIPGHVTMFSSTPSLYANFPSSSNTSQVGCDISKFTWCSTLRPVNLYLYYISYCITIGIAFPVLNITVATLFSKILGPRRQGTQQGIFQASGGIARMIGPIAVSMLYTKYGPRMAWNMEILVISATLLAWCLFYRRLIPLQISFINLETEESSSKKFNAKMFPVIRTISSKTI